LIKRSFSKKSQGGYKEVLQIKGDNQIKCSTIKKILRKIAPFDDKISYLCPTPL
jgi:hypothetical protein